MKKSIGAKLAFSPLPTLVIGTYNTDMEPNVMTASFGGIVSAVPPTLGISIRKATLTYENIVRSKVFSVSIPSQDYIKEMDYFGLVSGKNNAKFLDTGLTATKGTFVAAPYVEEFPVNIECKLIKTIELGSHIQFIGEIVEVKGELNEKGIFDIAQIKPISFVGSDNGFSYYGLGTKLGKAFSVGMDIKVGQSAG